MKSLIDYCSEFFVDDLFVERKNPDQTDEEYEKYCKERKIDALCCKVALNRFLRTGTKENAFDVFFCYAEMFKPFGDGLTQSANTVLNLLYDHEIGVATLLKKHRDHYSHSVYNFAMGLIFFDQFATVKNAFERKYLHTPEEKERAYYYFLKAWGLAALFHDVGYPLEITFDNLIQYQTEVFGTTSTSKKTVPNEFLHVAYENIDKLIALSPSEKKNLGCYKDRNIRTINDLLSVALSDIWKDENGNSINIPAQYITDFIVKGQPIEGTKKYLPKTHMDHAYFSCVILLKKLLQTKKFSLDELTMDAILAILLHAGFFRYSLRGNYLNKDTKLRLAQNPLAYLLTFCDELQCWDRTPYGKTSKEKVFPWDMDLAINNRGDVLKVTYHFRTEPISEKNLGVTDKKIKEDSTKFLQIKDLLPEDNYTIFINSKKSNKKIYTNLSETRYMDLLEFAKVINAHYDNLFGKKIVKTKKKEKTMDELFSSLSLEYKLSNIQQAKSYAEHLNSIGCFFSSKHYDFEKITYFTPEEKSILAKNEHIRWTRNQANMGWTYGRLCEKKSDMKDENFDYLKKDRDIKRLHKDMIPYDDLDPNERLKDISPMEKIIQNLSELSNLSVYKIPTALPKEKIGCLGHRNLMRISDWSAEKENSLRADIRKMFRERSKKNDLIVYSCFAAGADLLFVEEALNCGLPVVAILSKDWKDIWETHEEREKFGHLFAQVSHYEIAPRR